MDKRVEWILLGRKIGTGTGWDDVDVLVITIYDFEPAQFCKLPIGTVTFDLNKGIASSYDDGGNELVSLDIMDAIGACERVETPVTTLVDP